MKSKAGSGAYGTVRRVASSFTRQGSLSYMSGRDVQWPNWSTLVPGNAPRNVPGGHLEQARSTQAAVMLIRMETYTSRKQESTGSIGRRLAPTPPSTDNGGTSA